VGETFSSLVGVFTKSAPVKSTPVTWAYWKETIRGAERNLPDFFGLCLRCRKKFPEKLSKIVVDGGGRSNYEKFLLDSIFPTKLTEFPTKLTEFVPHIFIISQYCPTVKRILPDWHCLPNNLGGGAAAPSGPPPGTPMASYWKRCWVLNSPSSLTVTMIKPLSTLKIDLDNLRNSPTKWTSG
jgi:hypothetical protein